MSSSSGVGQQAFANTGTAQGLQKQYAQQSGQTLGTLSPLLTQMATNPTGYSAQDRANQTTAAMQSLGGSQAGLVGGANQMAARTNNAGAFTSALDNAARGAAAGASQAALDVQNQNANVKLQQQRQALGQLQGLYGEQVGAGENALSQANAGLQVANQAKQVANSNPWTQLGVKILGAGATGDLYKGY